VEAAGRRRGQSRRSFGGRPGVGSGGGGREEEGAEPPPVRRPAGRRVRRRRPGGGGSGGGGREEEGAEPPPVRPWGHRFDPGGVTSRSIFFSGRPESNRGPNSGAERLCKRAEPNPVQA
jgi:hypothetical protein